MKHFKNIYISNLKILINLMKQTVLNKLNEC